MAIPLSKYKVPILIDGGLKPVWMTGTVFILVFVLCFIKGGQKLKINEAGFGVIIILASALSYFNLKTFDQEATSRFLRQSFRLLWVVSLFICISSTTLSKSKIKTIIQVWVGIGVIVSLVTIYDSISLNTQLPVIAIGGISNETQSLGGYIRPSIIIEPVRFCEYLLPIVVFTGVVMIEGGVYYSEKIIFSKWTNNLAALALLIIGYFVTFSLGGVLAAGGFIVIYSYYSDQNDKIYNLFKYAVYSVVGLGLSTIILYAVTGVNLLYGTYVRVLTIISQVFGVLQMPTSEFASTSYVARLESIKISISAFLENPLIGAGLANTSIGVKGFEGGAHSGFIQLLGELGLIGLLVFTSLLTYTIIYINTSYIYDTRYDLKVIKKAMLSILIARVVFLLIQGNWVNVKTWFDISFSIMVVRSLNKG